ncbi:MAG TPA: hypothetical protein VLC92_08540 [Rhodocyclaceae bacterium]|nr:hypothetical protein [Rhodocyclaceae bacterium]
MNVALEFHDSQVSKIDSLGRDLSVSFSSAYIHRSVGKPGVDSGSGYIGPVEMLLSEADWAGPLNECMGKLSDGRLSVAGKPFALVPLPSEHTGRIALELVFANGAALTATAQSLVVRFSGEPHFVESFFC